MWKDEIYLLESDESTLEQDAAPHGPRTRYEIPQLNSMKWMMMSGKGRWVTKNLTTD